MNAKQLLFSLLLGNVTAPMAAYAQPPVSVSPSSLYFMENKGQITDQKGHPRTDLHFRLTSSGMNLFTGSGHLHYQWAMPLLSSSGRQEEQKAALYRMDVTLMGSNPQAEMTTGKRQAFYERYYLPHLGKQGTIAYAYQQIRYKNVYPHIDWVLYIKEGKVEYDFIIHPGGKVSDIQLQYSGTDRLSIDEQGRLTAVTPFGTVTESAPVGYQEDGVPVATSFVLDHNILSFKTAAHKGVLTIDPTLNWSTYYGGNAEDITKNGCITGDPYGNTFLAGQTNSTMNIATTGSFKDTLTAQYDAFLVRFNSSGNRLWATYYGGATQDYGMAAVTDRIGGVYLTGYSNGNGLSTTGSHQATKGSGYDALLVKFDTSGTRLWATYYGGSATEQGLGVVCDRNNNVYMTGFTNNSTTGIATGGAHQTAGGGGNDAFLVKFNSAGIRQWGTYYGGSGVDQGLSLACDTIKNVFLAGYTLSGSGIATANAHQTTAGGNEDGFLVKFDSSGTRLWATYYGGSATDMCQGVICDQAGNPSLVGYTQSTTGIATAGSHQPAFFAAPGADAFLVKFNAAGVRQWGTYYGDTGDDWGLGITTDRLNNIFITGFTGSHNNIATPGSFKDTLPAIDLADAFLVKFSPSGNRVWGSYLGGDDVDMGYGLYCDTLSRVYIAGVTYSVTGFATTGAHQTTFGGGSRDAFLSLINDCDLFAPSSVTGADTVCKKSNYSYTVPSMAGAVSYTWTLPTGWSGNSNTNSINILSGTASDTIRVHANYVCGSSSDVKKYIVISPRPVVTPSGNKRICYGDSVLLTSSGAIRYQWLYNGSSVLGDTLQNLAVSQSGHFNVVTLNAFGCRDTSATDTVTVHPLPTPVITATGATLATGNYNSYQWNYNGTPIGGAVGSTYTITVMNGNYTVTVTDSNGCEGTSASFDGSTLGTKETANSAGIHIYPNPATDRVFVQSSFPLVITLYNIDGQIAGYYKNATGVDIGMLSDGLYLMRITDANGLLYRTQRIVKHTSK
ncbi:MAG TPA: SBBP repeat-containing protein [Flavipsychrobacter sp.]|nr:SBBP repeat-containing protein [Flavipsychrobacter sp.]